MVKVCHRIIRGSYRSKLLKISYRQTEIKLTSVITRIYLQLFIQFCMGKNSREISIMTQLQLLAKFTSDRFANNNFLFNQHMNFFKRKHMNFFKRKQRFKLQRQLRLKNMKLLFNQAFDSLMRAQDVSLLKNQRSTSAFLDPPCSLIANTNVLLLRRAYARNLYCTFDQN